MSVPWLLLWEIGFPKDKAIVFFLKGIFVEGVVWVGEI